MATATTSPERTGQRTCTVRVNNQTLAELRALSRDLHQPMSQVLADAIQQYRRRLFWNEFNAAVERLQADPGAWAEEQAERALWDSTLKDGLEPEVWTDADVASPVSE